MPDITLVVQDISGPEESERLERALGRLRFVKLVSVNPARNLIAISYTGGAAELHDIGDSIRNAGHDFELSPGARELSS